MLFLMPCQIYVIQDTGVGLEVAWQTASETSLEYRSFENYVEPDSLLGSFFVPRFWVRLFFPVGLYLNELVRFRRRDRTWFTKSHSRER